MFLKLAVVLAVVAIVFAAASLLLVVPIWSIFDAFQKRRGERWAVLILAFFFWAITGMIYGIFMTDDPSLRKTAIAGAGALLVTFLLIPIAGVGSALDDWSKTKSHQPRSEKSRTEPQAELRSRFKRQDAVAKGFKPFTFIARVPGGSGEHPEMMRLEAKGPDYAKAVKVLDAEELQQVVVVDKKIFGIDRQRFGVIGRGVRFERLAPPPGVKLARPRSLAYDLGAKRILVLGLKSALFYDVPAARWSSVKGLEDVAEVAYDPESEGFVALAGKVARAGAELDELRWYDRDLRLKAKRSLKQAIELENGAEDAWLQANVSGGKLYLVQNFAAKKKRDVSPTQRFLTVDLVSGDVREWSVGRAH